MLYGEEDEDWEVFKRICKRFIFMVSLPFIVKIVFGKITFMGVGLQRVLTIVIILIYFLWLLLIALYVLGFFNKGRINSFIVKWVPSAVRAKAFLKKFTHKNSHLSPSTDKNSIGPLRWTLYERLPAYLITLFFRF